MQVTGITALLVWLFIVIGVIANIWQTIILWLQVEAIGEASGFLFVKTITIFIPFVGSVMGWVGFF